ncbi:PH domain-containing protein [Haloplanus ruber]|uniref:PH domain-containing protein n=1 Tax=Haloplanus ruber TaxID=869892 RepID=A0ABD6CZZ1_9EURY|nr:PH domain-containing protein [Haloplanus ruber]
MVSHPDWFSLDTGETMVRQGAPRVRRVLPAVVAATLWLGLLAVGAVVAVRTLVVSTPVAVGAAVLLALPAVAGTAWRYLRTVNVEYVLTDRNCYRKRGVLSTSVTRVGLGDVERTALHKNVWGSIFDYGTVSISTAGTDGVDLRLTDLDGPEAFRDELQQRAGHETGDGSTGGSIPDSAGLDAATAETLLTEFTALHAAADRLDREVSDG